MAMTMLPLDIIVDEILPRLPTKSLVRFKSLSKHFKTLISTPKFATRHLHHSTPSAADNLFVIHQISTVNLLHSFDPNSPKIKPKPLPLPKPFKLHRSNAIVASCNGLLLLQGSINSRVSFLLVNPSTGFYSKVSWNGGTTHCSNYGLGYDPSTNDHKLVAFSPHGDIMIYSVTTQQWRYVHATVNNSDTIYNIIEDGKNNTAVVLNNHLFHWLFWCRLQSKHQIFCFDICSEHSSEIPLPNFESGSSSDGDWLEIRVEKQSEVTGLRLFEGCLSVVETNVGRSTYDVWVMKEYGVEESWVKLIKVTDRLVVPLVYAAGSSDSVALVYRGGSKDGQGRLVWQNVGVVDEDGEEEGEDGEDGESEIHGVHRFGDLNEVCVIRRSLVMLPGDLPMLKDNKRGR